jgi:hypothetical protein
VPPTIDSPVLRSQNRTDSSDIGDITGKSGDFWDNDNDLIKCTSDLNIADN